MMPMSNGGISNGGAAGYCTKCRKASVCVCNRCGDFYCSPECQRVDWRSHRYICFPMPTLVRAEVYNPHYEGECLPSIPSVDHKKPAMMQRVNNNNYPTLNSSGDVDDTSRSSQRSSYKNKFKKAASPAPATIPLAPYPKDNSRVILCGFRTPNRCHVRSANPEDVDQYLKIAKLIDSYGKTAPPLTKLPKPHSYAISKMDGIMCRVEIMSVRSASGIRVLFCDHGTMVVRQLGDLREISNELVDLPQYAVWVQLRNVLNYAISEELMSYLSGFEDQEFTIKYENEENGYNIVELVSCETKQSLNQQVAEHCKHVAVYVEGEKKPRENGDKSESSNTLVTTSNAKPITPESNPEKAASPKQEAYAALFDLKRFSMEQPRVMVAPFETHVWKTNAANFKVLVLDNSCLNYGYFGCIAESDLQHLIKVQEYLNNYEDTKELYKPKLDEFCIAKFESEWYRAKVTEIPDDDNFTVVYIDFTNESTLTSEDIRRYPSDLDGDCRTMLCLIDGLPENIEGDLLSFLKDLVAYRSKFIIDRIKEINQGIVVIECSDLMAKLMEKKLL